MIEKQELHCHACLRYVQFEIDVEVNGNYTLDCPNCGHEHCRVVNNGVITDVRWDQRNGPLNGMPVFQVYGATASSTSSFTSYQSSGASVSFDTYLWADSTFAGSGTTTSS